MPFKITHHDEKYFHAQGSKGPFKIAKKGLSKPHHDRYLAMCGGGVVPRKMAKGGETESVDPMLGVGPSQEDVNRSAAQMVNSVGIPVARAISPRANSIGETFVTGVRSLLPGSPGLEEERRRYRQDAGASSVVHPPLDSKEALVSWSMDPENPDNTEARDLAAGFIGAENVIRSPQAGVRAVATTAENHLKALGKELPSTGPARPPVREVPRTRVGLVPWNEMNLPEAVAAARNRAHLLQLENGHYVGAPPQITNPARLAAMRGKVDKAVAKGAFGADWYERARGAIHEIANDDPRLADYLSKQLANYSPQATPDTNFGWAIQQMNRGALEGAEASALVPPKTEVQARKGARILAGEDIDLGPKAGIYEQHINPNKAEEAKIRGVNDLWQGRVFGYPPTKNGVKGASAKAGFSDAQHSFMTGENLLAAERAKEAGLIPQVAEPNVGNVQAASWVGQRYQQLLDKQKARAKKAAAEGKPFKPVPDAELRRRAMQSYDTVLDKYTANETYETIPGRNVAEHMEGVQDLSPEARREYTEATRWSPEGVHDPFYQAAGVPSRPAQGGLGEFTIDLPGGVKATDYNPNVVAKPMVSFTKNPKGGINAPEGTIIEGVNAARSVLDAQAGGAWNAPRMSGGGKNAARVRFPAALDEAATKNLYAQAKAAGLQIIDNGGGSFTLTDPGFGSMSATDFGKALRGGMGDALAGARVDRARYVGDYSPVPWGKEGEGTATQWMLGKIDPRLDAKFDANAALRQRAGDKVAADIRFMEKHGTGAPRADIQRLRKMISDEGFAALRDYVAKNGPKGLPAFIPLALADWEKDQAPKHAHGGEVQRFAGGTADVQPVPVNPMYSPAPVMSTMPVAMDPTYSPAPNMSVGFASPDAMPAPITPEETRASIIRASGGDPAQAPDPLMTPTAPGGPVYGDSNEGTGMAAVEGETPFGLGTAWDSAKDWLRQDVAQGLRGYGQLADNVLPSNLGSRYMIPAAERLAASGSAPEGAPAPLPPYNGPMSPGWNPNLPMPSSAAGEAPAVPQPPQVRAGIGGTGVPGEIQGAERSFERAAQEKAKIEQNALAEMQGLQQRAANAMEQFSAMRQQRYEERQKIADQLEDDVRNARVNPFQFYQQADTGSKILAGIGMLFSGMGSGLTGQPNLAIDLLNRAIDRDIDAQKFNIGKKQNFLSYYVKKTGDELVATNFLKADLLDSTAAMIEAKRLGMQSGTVGPLAQMTSMQMRMQAAELRQRAALQEQQMQINQYNFEITKARLGMMQQMLGAAPGAAMAEDHTPFLRSATVLGVVPRNETAQEQIEVPVRGPNGQPVIDPRTGQAAVQHGARMYWYPDPERAREADHVYRTAPTLKRAVTSALSILQQHGTGTRWLQDPAANAALNTELSHVLVAYESMVNGMKRQPNAETIEVIKKAVDNPGGVTSSILGSSAASLKTILKQVDATLQAQREGAYF